LRPAACEVKRNSFVSVRSSRSRRRRARRRIERHETS
jgi:hypothetical protein